MSTRDPYLANVRSAIPEPVGDATNIAKGSIYGQTPGQIWLNDSVDAGNITDIAWNGVDTITFTQATTYQVFPNNVNVTGARIFISVFSFVGGYFSTYGSFDVVTQTDYTLILSSAPGGFTNPASFSRSIGTYSGSFSIDFNYKNVRIGRQPNGIPSTQPDAIKNNVGIGTESVNPYSTDGSFYQNVGVGVKTLQSLTTGSDNVSIGYAAGQSITVGSSNIGIGSTALVALVSGSNNIGIGNSAGPYMTDASNNVLVGYSSGYQITSGLSNVAIGPTSNTTTTTGSNNITIGLNAQPTANNTNNSITLGNSSITSLRCQVTTIASLSDERDKTDIQDNELGLDFINDLHTRKFRYDCRDWYTEEVLDDDGNPVIENGMPKTILVPRDGTRASDKWVEGFVAQELQEVVEAHDAQWLGIVDETNPDKLEASAHKVVIPLVKAVQELSAMVTALQNKVAELEAR